MKYIYLFIYFTKYKQDFDWINAFYFKFNLNIIEIYIKKFITSKKN